MVNGTDLDLRDERTSRDEHVLRATTFDVVVGGYDRRQVDVCLDYVEVRIAEYQEDIDELEQLLGTMQQLLAEHADPSYAGLGRRARQLLQLAEEEAGAITAAAEEKADAITAAAGREADAIRAAAHRDAERIRVDLERQRSELNTRLARLNVVLTEVPGIDPDRPAQIALTRRNVLRAQVGS